MLCSPLQHSLALATVVRERENRNRLQHYLYVKNTAELKLFVPRFFQFRSPFPRIKFNVRWPKACAFKQNISAFIDISR